MSGVSSLHPGNQVVDAHAELHVRQPHGPQQGGAGRARDVRDPEREARQREVLGVVAPGRLACPRLRRVHLRRGRSPGRRPHRRHQGPLLLPDPHRAHRRQAARRVVGVSLHHRAMGLRLRRDPGEDGRSHRRPGTSAPSAGGVRPRPAPPRANVLGRLGEIHLRQGGLDGALSAWSGFLGCAEGVQSVRVRDAAEDMRVRLARYPSDTTARELSERAGRLLSA